MIELPVARLLPFAAMMSLVSSVVPASGQGGPPAARADTVVRQAGPPLHPGVASLVQELSIGRDDGPDEYIFGDIGEVVVGANGSIIVYDGSVPVLRMYDATGKYLRAIGRKGQGPGEYLGKLGMTVLTDGRLLFWDGSNWRVNVYSADGRTESQWSTPSGSSGTSNSSSSRALMAETSGMITRRASTFLLPSSTSQPNRPTTIWIRSRADGSGPDTLVSPSLPQAPSLRAASPSGSRQINVPFMPFPLIARSPLGYFVSALPNRYAIDIVAAGQPVVSIRRDVPPEPVSADERTRERARVTELLRSTDPNWTWNGPDIPRTKPFFTDLRVAADGRIWTMVSRDPLPPGAQPLGGMGGGTRGRAGGPPPAAGCSLTTASVWDVFEPAGSYVGRVAVPKGVSMWVMRGDVIWATACTDDDAERVRRYRIAWATR
jgi:hypothetical protein